MKILASILLTVAFCGLMAWEANWRLDHSNPGQSVATPDGLYVAQARSLPEVGVLPYGRVVFVRLRFVPLWATSKMVFAAYCKPGEQLTWRSSNQLEVGCIVSEGAVMRFPAPDGIVVTIGSGT